MKSTNAGNNWSIYYTMQEENNVSMHFINENTGFIVCDSGKVLKSINGGLNWNVIYDFEQEGLHKIYFSDFQTGYILRHNRLYNYEGTGLYRTTNGGTQWSEIINDTTYTIEGLSFPGNQTGYLAGYGFTPHPNTFYTKFLRSTNYGLSWDSISNVFYSKFFDCKFIDVNTGFAYGERVFSAYRSLYRTTNGGVNWQPAEISYYIRNLEQIDNNTFLVNTVFSGLHKSTNSGINWFPYNNSFSASSFKFTDGFNGLAVNYGGTIIKSSNSGLNWSNISTSLASNIWDVDFVNENTGYACDQGRLLKTTNGGSNWLIVYNDNMYQLDFVDANTGYFGGDNILYKTTDGGQSVTVLQYTVVPGTLNEIQFLNANTGFIMGKYNLTWKTTNGGSNWTILSGYGSGYHECLYFYNENLGFIGREDYNLGWGISRTTNGGLNWDFQTVPNATERICDFYFTGNTTGYFTTRNQIFKTTNSGGNWFSVYNYNNDYYPIDMYGIQFVNNDVGYAAITNGKVLKTTNAGVSWSIHNSLTNYSFTDLYFTDVNTGYFVGSDGVILKTTNGGGSPIGIEPISSSIPESFELFQNYPNPFNPVTTIRFTIRNSTSGRNELTTLKIFDILGKEISVPVSEILSPGEYEISWDASGYPSGVYFCILSSGSRSTSLKIMLVK